MLQRLPLNGSGGQCLPKSVKVQVRIPLALIMRPFFLEGAINRTGTNFCDRGYWRQNCTYRNFTVKGTLLHAVRTGSGCIFEQFDSLPAKLAGPTICWQLTGDSLTFYIYIYPKKRCHLVAFHWTAPKSICLKLREGSLRQMRCISFCSRIFPFKCSLITVHFKRNVPCMNMQLDLLETKNSILLGCFSKQCRCALAGHAKAVLLETLLYHYWILFYTNWNFCVIDGHSSSGRQCIFIVWHHKMTRG